ncbi:hypothetical protein BT96DRAFT_991898 [Gymnopus androsaceus JB14]|uniref:Uncharacterized protein n=1 Tax=Gymnopus androsaceus JB14 TaxID=1447944 RepID=A0A6A4HV55_9AGAR|nr:hypothetical protein BT96DRAFT_991898 [Gymnopus androsaceus JB14]
MSGITDDGKKFQRAYAFRSLRDAVMCQMLNNFPTSMIHNYNPQDNSEAAAALREILLEVPVKSPVKAESPELPELPLAPEHQSTPPPDPASAPLTPKRSQSAPSYVEYTPSGRFNIFVSPNIAVRVNSPGPGFIAPDPSSPGPSTPSRTSQMHEWAKRGRRMLLAEELDMDDVFSIEGTLMSCDSREEFADIVCGEFGLKRLQALDDGTCIRAVMARQKASNNFARLLHALKRRKAERRKKFAAQKKTYKEAIIHVHKQIKQMATEIHHQFNKKYSMDEIATNIFQSHRLRTATKDVGRYHAFVSMQSKIMNAETPEGEPKKKVNKLSKEILKKWKTMLDEEKNSLTKDILVELRERRALGMRENKEVGEHKPGAVAAQDSFMTGEQVQDTLKWLNMHTGDEALLIITSGSLEQAHRPYAVTTGPRVDSFCTEVLKLIPDNIGAKMDGFMVTEECAGSKTKISRMYYSGFMEQITKRYGIVLRNWPLEEFKNPSSEFSDWLDAYNAPDREADRGVNGVGMPTPSPTPAPAPIPATASGSTAAPPPIIHSITKFVPMAMVTDANGIAVPVKKTIQKKCCDSGKTRPKRSTVAAAGDNV